MYQKYQPLTQKYSCCGIALQCYILKFTQLCTHTRTCNLYSREPDLGSIQLPLCMHTLGPGMYWYLVIYLQVIGLIQPCNKWMFVGLQVSSTAYIPITVRFYIIMTDDVTTVSTPQDHMSPRPSHPLGPWRPRPNINPKPKRPATKTQPP